MLARLYSTRGFDLGGTPRLPSITTLFFTYALRTLFTPSSTFYPLMSRFLLQRPEFDPHDPPMLYSMLYSGLSSESWKKEGSWKRERIWILKFLADGMVSTQDWEVLKRRHTWDLLATAFTAHRHDRTIRVAVLKVTIQPMPLRLLT
jgi:nucleolar pre-ribosomal-associated protein 1